jgi:outer membrane protein OmpA-like peptidoglycan-associated protein
MYRLILAAATVSALALVGCSDSPAEGTPALSSVPGSAPGTSTPAQRRQLVAALIADRDNARYTDEQLRAGPPDLPPPTPRVAAAPRATPPAVPQIPVAVAPVAPLASPPQAPGAAAQPAVMAAPAGDVLTEVYRRALAQTAPAATPVYVPTASAATAQIVPAAVAAVPAPVAMAQPASAAGAPSDPFMQSYQAALARSTAGINAPTVGYVMPAPTIVPQMAPASPAPAVAATGLLQPTAIRFGANSSRLTAEHRTQIAATVEQWRTRPGVLRVVSQSSDGAAARPADQGLASFRIAGERAEAVAAELRRHGVPAGQIQIDSRTGALAGGAPARQVDIFLY